LESCSNNEDCTLRPKALNASGEVLRKLGKLDEAIAKYQKAIELDPQDALASRNWALALTQQGKSDEAKAKEKKASERESMATQTPK
jgi:tetratricopeptide (TPR) repeat protein